MRTRHDPLPGTGLWTLPGEQPRSGWQRAATWTETTLWLVALGCLAFVAWNVLDATLYQQRAATALERTEVLPPAEGDAAATVRPVALGAPVGRLEIPRLEMSVVVAEGADESVLRRAVGRIPSSAIPGDGGNLALAGHRDTFFRPLEDVRVGDRIVFEPARGEATTYEVRWTRVVEPDATWVAAPTLEPVLTLVTCYPFRYLGAAPSRFVVRAQQVAEPSAVVQTPVAETAAEPPFARATP